MSDCTIVAQVLEKREEPAEYLVDRMIRICRDQLMLPIRQTMAAYRAWQYGKYVLWKAEGIMCTYIRKIGRFAFIRS